MPPTAWTKWFMPASRVDGKNMGFDEQEPMGRTSDKSRGEEHGDEVAGQTIVR